eukprot:6178507-Pleurochrysis_carterae.AAC.3
MVAVLAICAHKYPYVLSESRTCSSSGGVCLKRRRRIGWGSTRQSAQAWSQCFFSCCWQSNLQKLATALLVDISAILAALFCYCTSRKKAAACVRLARTQPGDAEKCFTRS